MSDPAQQSFLGTGWSFPPSFDRRNATVLMTGDVMNIKQSLWILFSTSLGERVMLAGYGTALWSKVFGSLTTTFANSIASLIATAILDWEPRIDVTGISVTEVAPLPGRLQINVDFIVRQTNIRSNLVYPFYLQEATLPPPPP